MLMSAGIELPRKVWVHGWLLAAGGDRMSKSRGNMLDPSDVVAALGADGARYVTLREVPFDKDAEVSWDSFVRRYNADLANDFGNLVNRTVSMARRYFGDVRPDPVARTEGRLSWSWWGYVEEGQFEAMLDGCMLHDALGLVFGNVVGEANQYVEQERPWDIAKAWKAGDEAAGERLRGVLGDLIEACRVIALAGAPFMPTIAPRVLEQLGYAYPYGPDGNGGPPLLDELKWGRHAGEAGTLGTPAPLFPRLESEAAADQAG